MSGGIAAVVFTCASALLAQGSYVLKAARMFDSTSGQLVTPGVVVVSNGVIQSVGSGNAPARGFLSWIIAATARVAGDPVSKACFATAKRASCIYWVRAIEPSKLPCMASHSALQWLSRA